MLGTIRSDDDLFLVSGFPTWNHVAIGYNNFLAVYLYMVKVRI